MIGWVQRPRDPIAHHVALAQPTAGEHDRALHAQARWERQLRDGHTGVRAFGGYTVRGRATDLARAPLRRRRAADGRPDP